jgi:superfamily II DNA or RNA helicase
VRRELRPYQHDAVDAVFASWGSGMRRPALVLPTGAGKTEIFCSITERWMNERANGRRALFIAHRTELIDQAAIRMRAVSGGALTVGIVKGHANQTQANVIVGSIQTLAGERRRRMVRGVGLVVVDECHMAAAPSYRAVLEHYGCLEVSGVGEGQNSAQNRSEPVDALGVTATMSRGDGVALGSVWQDVAFERTITEMIVDGWLVRPRGVYVRVDDLDLRGVRRASGADGDYRDGDLGRAIEASSAPQVIAKAVVEHAPHGQGIVFAPTVASADMIAVALRDAGFSAQLIHGGTPAAERSAALDEYRAGRLRWLVNCMVFTHGTDLPMTDTIVIARPTVHNGLYVQMVGRGLRLWCPVHRDRCGTTLAPCCGQMKADALVLDTIGVTRRHKLQARIELFGEAPAERMERELTDDGLIDVDDIKVADEDGEGPAVGPVGPLISTTVDLFGGVESEWQRTAAGVWFLHTGLRYLIVLPGRVRSRPGFDVFSVGVTVRDPWRVVRRGVRDLGLARALAEGVRTPEEGRAGRNRWRLNDFDGMARAAAVVQMATMRIDPFIPSYVDRE